MRVAATVVRAMEVLRPGFEAWRDGLDAAARAEESLTTAEGYLRDAALGLRAWEVDPAEVACPLEVRHGDRDGQASLRNARWLAAHVPGAVLHVERGAEHLPSLHAHWPEILSGLADVDRRRGRR